MMDRTTSHHRLKIVVHIDSNMERACIEVRGTLTPANIRALYVIARRARTLLPGKEIVLDLTMARAAMETIEALHDPVHITELSGAGTGGTPLPSANHKVHSGRDTVPTTKSGRRWHER